MLTDSDHASHDRARADADTGRGASAQAHMRKTPPTNLLPLTCKASWPRRPPAADDGRFFADVVAAQESADLILVRAGRSHAKVRSVMAARADAQRSEILRGAEAATEARVAQTQRKVAHAACAAAAQASALSMTAADKMRYVQALVDSHQMKTDYSAFVRRIAAKGEAAGRVPRADLLARQELGAKSCMARVGLRLTGPKPRNGVSDVNEFRSMRGIIGELLGEAPQPCSGPGG